MRHDMNANKQLTNARAGKKDEFYTQLTDIEKELKYYKKHFKNKTVLCNCDDPRVSQFFHYFSYQFETLGLKKLITTCYKNQQMNLFSKNDSEKAIWLEYNGDKNDNRVPDPEEIGIHNLGGGGNGDFRSQECIDLLKQSDIVVTNPPFSLFREYLAQLIKYKKKFLIIGNPNAITNKEMFHLIKDNKIWLGNKPIGKDMFFDVPKNYADELIAYKKEGSGYKIIDGVVKGRTQGIWFTNLDIKKRHDDFILYKKYNKTEYPKYDNYNAINIDKVKEIPIDYDGVMGVPITFMDKFNPDQFEILGCDYDVYQGLLPKLIKKNWKGKLNRGYVNGKCLYARILIKHKKRIE